MAPCARQLSSFLSMCRMEINGVEDARPEFEELIRSCKSDGDKLDVYRAWIESAAAVADVARGRLLQVDGKRPSDYLEEKLRLIKVAIQQFPDNRSVSIFPPDSAYQILTHSCLLILKSSHMPHPLARMSRLIHARIVVQFYLFALTCHY
jgi:hypothetical protein